MAASRGDRKPCSNNACPGTMQYGRERPRAGTPPERMFEGGRGWVCDTDLRHFTPGSDRDTPQTARSLEPDDGESIRVAHDQP
jgi:hypothetical protein